MEILDPKTKVITNSMLMRTILALRQNIRPEVDGYERSRGDAGSAVYEPATADFRFPLVWKNVTYLVVIARCGSGWYITSSTPLTDHRQTKERGLARMG